MSFLNAMLLGGAAALLAPLLIHLLNRSRFQIVDWGAMHLLEAAVESKPRRFQWESWLLLLIRCLIPVLLAVALARPVLTQFKQSGADQKKSLVLLLDNSASMGATAAGKTLLELGKQALTNIAERSAGAELSLWTTTSPATDQLNGTTLKLGQLRAALERIGPAAGTDLAGEAVQVGHRARAQLTQPNQHIILASDFQASQWRPVTENEIQAISSQLSTGEFPAQLFLLPIRAKPLAKNLSIELIDAPRTARPDQPLQLSARVINHDNLPVNDVRITFQVSGKDLASRTIALASRASEQVEFACEFKELGRQALSVRVDDPGDVHGDDVFSQVVQITPTPKILIVDDSIGAGTLTESPADKFSGDQAFAGTSRFLRLALSPFAEPSQNPFQISWRGSSGLQQDLLTPYDAVVVASIHNPTNAMFDVLNDYVSTGGGLLVFGQTESSLARWQDSKDSLNRLLPMNYAKVQQRPAEQPARLAVPGSLNNSQNFLASSAIDIAGIEFTQWLELSPVAGNTRVHVLYRFGHGEPWLVEQHQGRGVVVQCASSCADEGTNLPSRPAYVPLMLSLVERITSAKLATGNGDGMTAESPLLSINGSREESLLAPLNDSELKALAARMGATLIDSTEEYARTDKVRRDGWELWRWGLAVVLGLLFAELLLGLRGSSNAWRGTT